MMWLFGCITGELPVDRSAKRFLSENYQSKEDESLRLPFLTRSNARKSMTERVILVVGACGLDRLLAVSNFPSPDVSVSNTI